jgi:hypothetical protein
MHQSPIRARQSSRCAVNVTCSLGAMAPSLQVLRKGVFVRRAPPNPKSSDPFGDILEVRGDSGVAHP